MIDNNLDIDISDRSPTIRLALVVNRGDFRLDFAAEFTNRITAIFGPSGSGKTTILRCIAGLLTPDRGEINVGGQLLFSTQHGINIAPERRRIGYLFQDGALFPHMTVIENIRYGYRLTPANSRRIDIENLLELLDLGGLVSRHIDSLSGGERQRVALARALAVSPGLLLLDEPTAWLDARFSGAVIGYLRHVREELGIPMIYVSHDVSSVLALADEVLLLRGGRVEGFGPPSRLIHNASNTWLAPGGSIENLLQGIVIKAGGQNLPGRVRVGEVELVIPPIVASTGDSVVVSIGANDIIMATEEPRGLSARNIVRGLCSMIYPSCGRVFVTVDIGTDMYVELTVDAVTELGIEKGKEVFLAFKSSSITAVPTTSPVE